MNTLTEAAPTQVKLMSGDAYRESLRRYQPKVFVDGRRVASVADEPALRPGVNALAFTYDYALRPELAPIALATNTSRNRVVSRMLHVNESAGDLLNKLEAVRVLCQETGCAQRYLAHDALNGIAQVVAHLDDAKGTTEHRARFETYLAHVQEQDLSLGIAMTDAKGDRSRKPHEQANPDTYVHIVERSANGIVISGTKAIVTGAPYMHELLVMPSRNMGREDAEFAVCCALRVDEPGITIVSRPAGRPGEKLEHGDALFSRKYGQATAVVIFERVFVPWERVFCYRDVALSNNLFTQTAVRNYTAHQTNTRALVKMQFAVGLAVSVARAIKADQFLHVQQMLGEILGTIEEIKSALVRSEVEAETTPHGTLRPALPPLLALRTRLPYTYPRVIEVLQTIAAGGFMMMPTGADFVAPELADDTGLYYQGAGMPSLDRVKLFKLAWDLAGESFGQRLVQYERYYAGDPVRNLAMNYLGCDDGEMMRLVANALELAGRPVRPG